MLSLGKEQIFGLTKAKVSRKVIVVRLLMRQILDEAIRDHATKCDPNKCDVYAP